MTTAEKDLQVIFDLFVETSKGKAGRLPLEGLKNWFKQANLTTKASNLKDADVGSAFKDTAEDASGVTFSELKEMISKLAKEKKMDQNEIIEKLSGSSTPQPTHPDNAMKRVGGGSV